ncbi:hypothetical protein VIGAN_06146400 [Vigna angularis var. angularis]|uniref:Uncharacterized protein n=1 Tax=Vigna angularis var. angularis TaxID=157739 RepID=A0A0S3SBS1_PHAAN|nr:hypothetical protein VIGAN_06146400 [Vigna angularis var. angularis]
MFSSYNIHWNYGLLPQTWENPSFANSKVEGEVGDNDPDDEEDTLEIALDGDSSAAA